MRIFEIENYLSKKIRLLGWGEGEYIYFNRGFWYFKDGKFYNIDQYEYDSHNWEEYKEQEKPKRFWKWILREKNDLNDLVDIMFYEDRAFIDDKGKMTDGTCFHGEVWDAMEKQKLVNNWIEIDDNGNLVNWSGKE